MKKIIMALVLFSVLSATAAIADEILYSRQPWLGDETDCYTVANWSQYNVPMGVDYYENIIVFDNFSLIHNATITDLTWWGGPVNVTQDFSFHIAIHDSANNLPGDLIASWDFDLSECNETYYADVYHPCNSFETINQYAVTLPEEISLSGNTEYWITIGADIDTDDYYSPERWMWSNDIPDYWGGSTFDSGDAIRTYNYDPATGTYTSYFYCEVQKMPCGTVGFADMAFELTGEVVPEPGTVVMIIAGLATVVGTIKARS